MNLLVAGICAYCLGFAAAIPLGATQLEIARRSLHGFPRSALMVVAGSVLSDTTYGAIAFFGIAPFLTRPTVVAIFWATNALLLAVFGILAVRDGQDRPLDGEEAAGSLASTSIGFITGLSLAVTNPLMVYWWLLGARLIMETGLLGQMSPSESLLVLFAGSSGIASYLTLMTFAVHRAKKFLSHRLMHMLTTGLAFALFGLALYSLVRAATLLKA